MRLPEALPKPFQIGIRPLGLAEWIDADDRLGAYFEEKARLWGSERASVFAAEPGTETAQAELLALLSEHLPARFPDPREPAGLPDVVLTGHDPTSRGAEFRPRSH